MADTVHQSVLADEVLALLQPLSPGMRLLDATVGAGGHSARLLERCSGCELVGIDADSGMLELAAATLASYSSVQLVQGWFDERLPELGAFDRILFDFGISMVHLKRAELGFSFREEGPLDMRLNRSAEVAPLKKLLERTDVRTLTDAIGRYGEERYAGRIAHAILRALDRGELTGTGALAEVVARAVPPAYRHGRTHPATRTFQALRIMVNDELGRIERTLPLAASALRPGGRLAAISFHSLEDRVVKHRFRALASEPIIDNRGPFRIVTRKPVQPGEEELTRNPAARSAKLRVLERMQEEMR